MMILKVNIDTIAVLYFKHMIDVHVDLRGNIEIIINNINFVLLEKVVPIRAMIPSIT